MMDNNNFSTYRDRLNELESYLETLKWEQRKCQATARLSSAESSTFFFLLALCYFVGCVLTFKASDLFVDQAQTIAIMGCIIIGPGALWGLRKLFLVARKRPLPGLSYLHNYYVKSQHDFEGDAQAVVRRFEGDTGFLWRFCRWVDSYDLSDCGRAAMVASWRHEQIAPASYAVAVKQITKAVKHQNTKPDFHKIWEQMQGGCS
jgi:hypothetical protein